jgi:membrane protease YdiL (CAAX protease family)
MDRERRSSLVALLLVAPLPTVGALVGVLLMPGPVGRVLWGVSKFAFYALPVVWLLFVDRRRPSWSPPRKGGFAIGTAMGLAIAAVIWITWITVRDSGIDVTALRDVASKNGFDTVPTYLGIAVYVCFVNALLEEYAFRWFIFTRCRGVMPAAPALFVSGLVFTAHHVVLLAAYGIAPHLVAFASTGVFIGGLAWSWCYHRFGSVWPGYVSHFFVDVVILVIGWEIIFGG